MSTMPTASAEIDLKLQRHLEYLKQDASNVNLLLTITDCYCQIGDVTRAQMYLDEAKKVSKEPFWTLQAILCLQTNQISKATALFSKAWVEDKSSFLAYHLALCHFLNQDMEQALNLLNNIDYEDKTQTAIILEARVLHHLQKVKHAIKLLEPLHLDNQSTPELLGLLALFYFDDNNLTEAKRLAKKAFNLDATNKEANLVAMLIGTLDNSVALQDIEKAIATTPEESRLWFALGTSHMRLMNINAAENSFAKATDLWAGFYNSWISLGWCHLLQNHLDKAWDDFQKALSLDTEIADAWGGLALVAVLRKNLTEAKHCITIASRIDRHCFPLIIAEIILANEENPRQAGIFLNESLPEVSNEIQRLLSEAILQINGNNRVLH